MFESIMKFFKKLNKKEEKETNHSREAAKERLHLVLMQDRANVSADFLELMKQEIIEVIKKYIDVDEGAIDVRLTNQENEEGTNGAPALYANIPIVNIKNEARKLDQKEEKKAKDKNQKKEDQNKEKQVKEKEQETEKEEQEDEKKVEKVEVKDEEETEIVEEIQNERIAKVILESKKYNEKINESANKGKENKKKDQEKIEDTKEEEPESEN